MSISRVAKLDFGYKKKLQNASNELNSSTCHVKTTKMKPRVSNHQIKVGLWERKKQSKRVKAVTVLIWSLWVNLTATPTWLEKKKKPQELTAAVERREPPLSFSQNFFSIFFFFLWTHTESLIHYFQVLCNLMILLFLCF